jgi:predicted MFS family arabinose efflux permease
VTSAEVAASDRPGRISLVLGLAMGPAVGLGLARFGYALLLPAMRADLHWSLATAGAVNTANAVGYLAGAVAAVPLARRLGTRQAFLAGLVLATLSLLGTAASCWRAPPRG